MERENNALLALRDGAVAVVVSFFFFYLGFGEFIFVFPLLLLSTRFKKKVSALAILVEAFIVVFYTYLSRAEGELSLLLMLFELYIPLSLLAAGMTWLISEGKRIGIRLLLALLPSILFFIILYVFLEQEPALLDSFLILAEDVFEALLSPFINFGAMDGTLVSFIIETILLVIASLIIPLVLCFVCATCFSFESVLHSRESDWEEKVMCLEYNPDAVWGFIVSWALVLLLRFVSAPLLLEIAVLNVAGIWTVVYAVQGFSVVFARLRRRSAAMRSMTLLIIVIVLTVLLPGINFIILIGLPLIGVLESFFDLKKLGGIDYENYS